MKQIEDMVNIQHQQVARIGFWYRHFRLLGSRYDRWIVHRNVRALFSIPYWALAYLGLSLAVWRTESARRLAKVQFLRAYWRWYFAYRACSFFTTRDLGPSKTGRLIISPRVHWLSSLFLFQALDVPVIIPLSQSIRDQLRVHPMAAIPNLGRLLKLVSIDDLPFESQRHNIEALLSRGYSVVVLMGETESHPRLNSSLRLSRELLAVIRSGVPTWMVDHSSFYQYQFATMWNPALVRVRVLALNDLLDPTQKTDHQVASAISGWMGYVSYDAVK